MKTPLPPVDVLAVGPHPDDIEIGIGGLIAKHVAIGHQVGLCDLTAGEMGSNGTVTERLAAALKALRHLRGKRVLVQPSGDPLTMKIVQDRVASAARRAGVRTGVHILRHTFCSHLAMRGAPGRAIQELAGHEDLKTTQRYMHLSPAAVEGAIRLLEAGRTGAPIGNMLATGSTESVKVTR